LGLEEKFDFVLAFYMVHEIPDKKLFFQEIRTLLKPGGKILIVEPKFHVNKKAFNRMVEIIEESGLKTDQNTPRIIFSRSLLAEA
jgi:SAM-dependent methyltransferase